MSSLLLDGLSGVTPESRWYLHLKIVSNVFHYSCTKTNKESYNITFNALINASTYTINWSNTENRRCGAHQTLGMVGH